MTSDKTLLIIAVIAVIVAGVGTLLTLTNTFAFERIMLGPTSPGNVTVDVISQLDILFIYDIINWSQGFVTPGATNATLDSEGNMAGSSTFRVESYGFVLENVGNVNASFNISVGKTPDLFLGGNTVPPQYNFKVKDCSAAICTQGFDNRVKGSLEDNAPSCGNSVSGFGLGVYTPTVTGGGTWICDQFGSADRANEVRVDLQVVIPENAPPGLKEDTLTASAVTAA